MNPFFNEAGGPGAVDDAIATALATILLSGLHSARPAASLLNAGCAFFETDTGKLFRSDGATWTQIAKGLTDTATPTTHGASHAAGGSDTIPGVDFDALAALLTNATQQGNSFNGASQLVKLDGSTRLPAVDGSLLTGLVAGGLANLSSGVVTLDGSADAAITPTGSPTVIVACFKGNIGNGILYVTNGGMGTWHVTSSDVSNDAGKIVNWIAF